MTDQKKVSPNDRSDLDFFELEEDSAVTTSTTSNKQLRADLPISISTASIGLLMDKDARTVRSSMQKLGLRLKKGSLETRSIFEYLFEEVSKLDKRKNRGLIDSANENSSGEDDVDEDDWSVGGFQNKNNPNNFKLFCEGQKKFLEVQILKGKYLPIADVMQSAYNTILNMVLLFEGLQDKVDDFFDDPDVSDQARDYIEFCRKSTYKHLKEVIKNFPVNEVDNQELEQIKEMIKRSISNSSDEQLDLEDIDQVDLTDEVK